MSRRSVTRGEDGMEGLGRGEENLGKQAHFLNSEKKTRPV